MKSCGFRYRGHGHGMFLSMFKKRVRIEKPLFVRLPTKTTCDNRKKTNRIFCTRRFTSKKYLVIGVDGFSRGQLKTEALLVLIWPVSVNRSSCYYLLASSMNKHDFKFYFIFLSNLWPVASQNPHYVGESRRKRHVL